MELSLSAAHLHTQASRSPAAGADGVGRSVMAEPSSANAAAHAGSSSSASALQPASSHPLGASGSAGGRGGAVPGAESRAPLSLDLSHLLASSEPPAASRASPRPDAAVVPAGAAAPEPPVVPAQLPGDENEALRVRGNMLRQSWEAVKELGNGRKSVLIIRAALALAQIVLGIAVVAMPTSLGNSVGRDGGICDPEGMFVFILLHTLRVLASLPLDMYLSLSPHRTPQARRQRSPEARAERERNRRVGTEQLDAKASRLSDLLGFVHCILFVVGNYTVWTSLECSRRPADSVSLWWASLAMIAISYVIIAEVAILVWLVVFFLPLLLVVLRALGLSDRLPVAGIRPETSKIEQSEIDKATQLVHFTPAEAPVAPAAPRSSGEVLRSTVSEPPAVSSDVDVVAIHMPLPLSRAQSVVTNAEAQPPTAHASTKATRSRGGGLARLFGRRRAARQAAAVARASGDAEASAGAFKYPLYPIEAHRATCPICLTDYEAPDASAPEAAEVLRKMPCGHVLHKECVDPWLSSVSGRCPVCQEPLVRATAAPPPARGADAA